MTTSAPVVSAEAAGASPVAHALRRLWVYVARNWVYYTGWSVLVLVYVGAFIWLPLLVGWAVEGALDPTVDADEMTWRCSLLLAVAVLRGVLRFFSRQLVFNAAREVEYEIRNDLFAHLQRLPQSFYFRWRTGDLMSRCVNDLNSVRMLLGPGLLSVVQTPVLFIGTLIALFSMNATLAVLVLLPYPLFIFVARAFAARMYARSIEVQEGLADLSNQVQEAVSGISVVKAYAMEDEQAARFAEKNHSLFERQIRLVWIQGGMPTITGLLPGVATAFVLLIGGFEIQAGRMSIGDFFAFTMFIYELTFPTFIMGWVVALVQRGAASMQRIDEILSTEPSIATRSDCVDIDGLRGEIEFRHLDFTYPADEREPALHDVTLRVPAGTSLGVVGPVGSGKSTLASVIPRLYEVEDGQVFLDGIDVNRIPLEILRRHIAMVPQDSFLFSIPLAGNIAYGLAPETPREEVVRAAERAQLSKDIEELPQGYDTVVGERGVMLSGGQRQRTALARALAMDPRILILDDTLSAVDAETESAIQSELATVFAGRTVVVVASRVSSVRDCDQIVVLDDGRIVERGDHDALVDAGGLYARLASEQARSDERRELEVDLQAEVGEALPSGREVQAG